MGIHEIKNASFAEVRRAHPTAAIIRPATKLGNGTHWFVFERADDAIGHHTSERRP